MGKMKFFDSDLSEIWYGEYTSQFHPPYQISAELEVVLLYLLSVFGTRVLFFVEFTNIVTVPHLVCLNDQAKIA